MSCCRHHAGLFGENGCNLPHLVTVIAQAFCLELFSKDSDCLELFSKDSEVYNKLKTCIASLQVSFICILLADSWE